MLKRIIQYTILVLMFLPLLAYSQDKYSTQSKKAIKYYEDGWALLRQQRFDEGIELLKKAVETDENFIEPRLMLGDVLSDLGRYDESIVHFSKAIEIDPTYFTGAFLNLSEVQVKAARYEDAKVNLEKYLGLPNRHPTMEAKAKELLVTAEFGSTAIKNPVPFDPKNLGPNVNSEHFEYFPALTADEQTIIITRNQRNKNGGRDYQEDFYGSWRDESGEWSLARNLGEPLNTDNNEGAQTISPDGRWMFFTGCNRRSGQGSCDIYFSRREGNDWTEPVNIGPPVNSRKWESQPSIAPDGRTLYFSSSRDGGEGKKDIWYSVINERGFWSQPVNLGTNVNTSGSEESPFIHPDGKTLYFASTGHPGMGMSDIFVSRKQEDGSWSKAMNLGYPINTANDENSLIVGASGEKAYFASDREGGYGNLDLYEFELYPKARPGRVTFMKGKVFHAETKEALQAKFELIDLETGESVYNSSSDSKTGEFLVGLPVNHDYALNVSKDGFLFYSENFALKERSDATPYKKDVAMQPIKKNEKVILKNIFFETASFELLEESNIELKKLLTFLEKNPTLKIEIGGHTDNVGSDDANQRLSENRARAVKDYLIQSGIVAERLTSKGYGESSPIDNNDTEEGRANNRRTEFTITSN